MPLTVLVIADPTAPYLAPLQQIPSEVRVVITNDMAQLQAAATDADVILNADLRGDPVTPLLPYARHLQWVHSMWAGVDRMLSPELIAHPAPLTNAKGIFAGPLADWTVAIMLYYSFDFPRVQRQQAACVWEPFVSKRLVGQTLGIVGYGGLGREAAERAKAFGVKILALRRNTEKTAGDPLVDASYPPSRLNELMAASDFVLVAAPLTAETRGMIGAEQIAAMKPSGVLINIGRGPLIDEDALLAALQAKKIRAAALDVFCQEPLPSDSPFYKMENVFVSPHTADRVEGFLVPAAERFLENLERFRKGEPLQYLVDKNAGY